jgi:ADP-heptose:LPS heptosyltransferase
MNQENKKTCLVKRKFGNLGDILMLTPSLKELSKEFKIDLQILEEYKEVLENLDFINKIYDFDELINESSYEKVVDISNYEFNYEKTRQPYIFKNKIEIFGEALNVNVKDHVPIIKLTKEEKIKAGELIQKFSKNKKIVLVAPKSKNPIRDWDFNNWKILIKMLSDLNKFHVIVVDEKINWEEKGVSFFNGKTKRELFLLTSIVDLVITPDSGLLHISGAFEKDVITLFGPTDHKMRNYKKSHPVYKDTGCYPCWYNRCEERYCLKMIKPEQVLEKVLEVLNE